MKKLIILLFYMTILGAQTTQWKLIWDENAITDSVELYRIFKAEEGMEWNKVDSIYSINGADTSVYIDSSIYKGILYYYKITAVNFHNMSSEYSDSVYAGIPKIINSVFMTTNTYIIINFADIFYDPDDILDSLVVESSEQVNVNVIISYQDKIIYVNKINSNFTGNGTFKLSVTDSDNFEDISYITVTYVGPAKPENLDIFK